MNKVRSLEEILHRCAAVLRCVANLQHRTLHEFDWFVSACIWGKDGSYGDEGTEVYRIYSDRTSFRLGSDDRVLVKWAGLFEDYCEREYGDDAKI